MSMETIIITGASSGIGKATAIQLDKHYDNFCFLLVGRNTDDLKATVNQMNNLSNQKFIYEFDLENIHEIPKLISEMYVKHKKINYLLNIAGYADPQPLLNTSVENLERTYKINVFAPVILIRETVKISKEQNMPLKIINIASTAGISPRPGWLSYSSSKAALISVSSTLTEELAEYNIKMYTLSPGRCATDLRRRLAPNEDQSKIMQPEEVAKVIVTLINKDENVLDGQNIIVRKRG